MTKKRQKTYKKRNGNKNEAKTQQKRQKGQKNCDKREKNMSQKKLQKATSKNGR